MQYNELGRTGIKVSRICLGTMTWGEQNTQAQAHEQLDYALSQGVNFIDTAEMYPVPPNQETYTTTEQYIGAWIQASGRRDDIVLASKIAGPTGNNNLDGYIRGGNNNFSRANHRSLPRQPQTAAHRLPRPLPIALARAPNQFFRQTRHERNQRKRALHPV